MTFTQIQYFLEICRTMNFTKAAQNLYVAQPSLSRQIQLLETELGVRLLLRSNRTVILTDAGLVFQKEFSEISDRIESAILKVKDAGTVKKEIHIGVFGGLSAKGIFDLVEKMKHFFEDYRIYINKYSSYNLKKAYEVGTVDIIVGFRGCSFGGEAQDCSCDIEALPAYIVYSDKLFGEEKRAVTFQDFNGKRLVSTKDEASKPLIDFQIDAIKKLGIIPSEYIQADNTVTTLLYTEPDSTFSVWCGGTQEGLNALKIPEDIALFYMNAIWKKASKLPLEHFFNEYYGWTK